MTISVLSGIMLSSIMLIIVMLCCNGECQYHECRYAESNGTFKSIHFVFRPEAKVIKACEEKARVF
jgi:hypothetical protein